MKKLFLTLAILLTTLISNAQIGVITVKKNENVPLNMWYTINEKETYIDNYELDGFVLKDYQSHPTIKAPLSN